jgi:hypothetical protein
MESIFLTKTSKAIVSILLIILLVPSYRTANPYDLSWTSTHAVISMIWYALMLVHIWQHWKLTKAMFQWKVMKRNVITFLTVIAFIIMTLTVLLFVIDVSESFVDFHHRVAHIFCIVIIIHTVQKFKRLVSLFKKKKVTKSIQILLIT